MVRLIVLQFVRIISIVHVHAVMCNGTVSNKIVSGTNAGEAFGQSGIGVYGKTWLERGKSLRVQFNFRSRRTHKKIEIIRLSIKSVEEADEVIRWWLVNRQSKGRKTKPVTNKCNSLFLRPIDESVMESSYHDFQNRQRKFGRLGLRTEPTESCPTTILKLKRARYVIAKRVARAEAKHHKVLQVIFVK